MKPSRKKVKILFWRHKHHKMLTQESYNIMMPILKKIKVGCLMGNTKILITLACQTVSSPTVFLIF